MLFNLQGSVTVSIMLERFVGLSVIPLVGLASKSAIAADRLAGCWRIGRREIEA